MRLELPVNEETGQPFSCPTWATIIRVYAGYTQKNTLARVVRFVLSGVPIPAADFAAASKR